MKKHIRIICTFLAVLMLCATFSLPVFAAKTSITAVVATSDLDEVAVLYGYTRNLNFTVEAGEPTRFNQSWVTCWEKYDEESGKWGNYSGRFYPGKYRVFAQLRIDGEDAKTNELAETVTCTVDGEAWTLETVSQHPDFSCVFATSPEIVIVDDPNIVEPVVVEHAYFNMTGYVAGQKFSDSVLYAHLGSEDKIQLIGEPTFIDLSDSDNNGMPDCMENQQIIPADDVIVANTPYLLMFSFSAKEGFDIYELESKNIQLPCKKANPMFDMLSGYDEETGVYRVFMALAPCVTEVKFTQAPTEPVGYYIDEDGEAVVSWESGAVDKYQISYYDEEYEDWNVYSNAFTTSFTFYYMGEAQSALYRIEAIKNGNTVATTEPFRITWKEKKALTLPIRIDGSAAAGSKTPVDLTEYYPTSDQYEFSTDDGLNCFIDGETGDYVTEFENGKEYGYAVSVVAKPGYYFENIASFMGTRDSIRIYGIGWEQVLNGKMGSDMQVDAIFTFTYNGETGIPSEPDKLLNELVFDGSSLVGATTPAQIPSEIFSHEALTLCGTHCNCTANSSIKYMLNFWEQREQNADPITATAFLEGKGYTYMLCFHVADGWSLPGVMNSFDFVLSGTGIDVVDIAYNDALQMLGVRLAFLCDDTNAVPAGDHTCIINKVGAVAPTCTENGNIGHYSCPCGKAYTDKWGMHETTDHVIAAIGHSFSEAWQTDTEGHWHECSCGEKEQAGVHADGNENGSCDICEYAMSQEDGLGAGAIVGIIIGSVAVLGGGGFCVYWFVIKKKRA